jgi:hypothetical protein
MLRPFVRKISTMLCMSDFFSLYNLLVLASQFYAILLYSINSCMTIYENIMFVWQVIQCQRRLLSFWTVNGYNVSQWLLCTLVALGSHWLLSKSMLPKEVTGCYGKSMVSMASYLMLTAILVAMDSQWL